MKKAIVLMSGGMDSLCVLAIAKDLGYTPLLLHIEYGQKTKLREKQAFDNIAEFYQIADEHRMNIHAPFLGKLGGSSLTDSNIPVSKEGLQEDHIPTSYVPFRNAHLISTAVSWAEVSGAEKIFIGANEEDSPGYPDCRPAYYEAFNNLIQKGTKEGNIEILTPIISLQKREIVQKCLDLKAPIELSWSCYESEDKACGQCDSCLLRLKGFKQLGVDDPIEYSFQS